jgi:alkanesulfonate monooxygenase SsuD/methylene tetrahydromethanopterin reductase-like flavin-dependent oxidoreductase (luciferase family)
MLAKQSAGIDAISGGRLTLGLGVGVRPDDFAAAGVPMKGRGRQLEQQLAVMKRVWAGEPLGDGIGPIGPPPASKGGPEILIGGSSPQAMRRVAKWGDGYIAGSAGPENSKKTYEAVEQAWKEAGRPGRPRFVAAAYYALGPRADEAALAYMQTYYAGRRTEGILRNVITTPDVARAMVTAFESAGVDELMLWPCLADLDQIDRLAELVR